MGVFLFLLAGAGWFDVWEVTYCWLHVRMNWAALAASVGFITEIWLAMIPTGNPIFISHHVILQFDWMSAYLGHVQRP